MAQLILSGVPYGQRISKCDEQSHQIISRFYTPSKNEADVYKQRFGNRMYYSLVVRNKSGKVFCDINGRSGAYFAITLVFENEYVMDDDKISKWLIMTYNNFVENRITQETPDGNRRFLTKDLDSHHAYVRQGMIELIKNNPEIQFTTAPLPNLQNTNPRDL